ncbi:MAG: ribosome biogenesis protein [bacterium]|nr:ribosome biogenesis protein [bacterium]
MNHIMKCSCGAYTMKSMCPGCGRRTCIPKPPKYSPEDRYGHYRRLAKSLV